MMNGCGDGNDMEMGAVSGQSQDGLMSREKSALEGLVEKERLLDELFKLEEEASRAIARASSSKALAETATAVLGKRSTLSTIHRQVASLQPEERKEIGQRLNEVRQKLDELIAEKRESLSAHEREEQLEAERMDLTEITPSFLRGHLHLVTLTQMELEDVFVGMGYKVAEGPEIETDWYNFEALNIPPDHPARGMWDTFYLEVGEPESVLLRTHTSPVQIRLMLEGELPIYAVAPGKCYRRDTADARHIPIFHQIEGLVVDRGITFGDLAGTIETFTTAYFGPRIHSRLRPSYFPFTEPSAEFEITCTICTGKGCRTCSDTGWVELGGCGMVDPAVFSAVGIDSEEWSGFAFGFGIERCAQMRHQIADLRALIENDIRFLEQF